MDARIRRLAAYTQQQAGLFTYAQAIAAGYPDSTISDRVVRGEWVRVLPRTYHVATTAVPPEARILAAWLAAGDPAAVSGLAAAHVWQVRGRSRVQPRITIPADRRLRLAGVEIVRTRRWSNREVVKHGALRVTTPMRTLLDLVPLVEEVDLEVMLDDAHRRGLVNLHRIDRYLRRAVEQRIPGASRLLHLISVRDPARPVDSGGETKLRRRLRLAGLPQPVPRVWVTTRSGPRRIDLAYPEPKVALELDSYEWHDGRESFDDDRIRDNDLADLGWERRHITMTMLDDPSPLVEWTVSTALGLRPFRWRPA